MSIDHSDRDIIEGGHRAGQQLLFTATQLVEVIARMRQQADTRRAETERAAETAAATAHRAAVAADRDRQRAGEQQARDTHRATAAADRATDQATAHQARNAVVRERADRARWSPAASAGWRRDATPQDLLTAWAAATTWAGHDPKAAAVMLRTEDEISRRWPHLADRYHRLRVHDGLHPAAAMKIALTDAVNAGWDPTTNPAATPRPTAPTRAALLPPPPVPPAPPVPAVGSGRVWTERIPSGPAAPIGQVWADDAANRALRWHRPVSAGTGASIAGAGTGVTSAASPVHVRARPVR